MVMKGLKLALLLSFVSLPSLGAEEARFFRVAGPSASTVTSFSADGYITWTNALTNATFIVQTALPAFGLTNWVDYIQVPVTTSVTTHRICDPDPPPGMAFIPAGSFTMGDGFSEGNTDERPTHEVYVSAFYMGRQEVTKALWDEVYEWATNRPGDLHYSFEHAAQGKASDHPAQDMMWYDAVKWCNARSEREGRVPAYYTSAELTNVYRSGQINLQQDWVNWNAGYRLPTEAEWAKAARGGASGRRFTCSDTDHITHSRANYYVLQQDGTNYFAYDQSLTGGYHPTFATNSHPYTSPVGYFSANGYGLFDMTGNVWEWCWDWYGVYPSSAQTDPRGPASGARRVSRGGSWRSYAYHCRAAIRGSDPLTNRYDHVGFRSVLPADQ